MFLLFLGPLLVVSEAGIATVYRQSTLYCYQNSFGVDMTTNKFMELGNLLLFKIKRNSVWINTLSVPLSWCCL